MGLEIGTLIALGGLAIGGVGTVVQMGGIKKAAKASKRAEAARKQMANLQHLRERRENIRKALFARAETTSNASNQGAIASSSFSGSLFQTTASLGRANVASRQNQELGNTVFAANSDIASGRSQASFGSGLQGFGESLFKISSSPFFQNT